MPNYPVGFGPRLRLFTQVLLPLAALSLGYARAAAAQTIQIDFTTESASLPSGYLRDKGDVYGNRGNGYTYGWSPSHTGQTYYYEPFPAGPNAYWSNIFLIAGSDTKWEIALANGDYQVYITAGGWLSANVHQKITAEGVVVVDATGGDYSPWVDGSATVTVGDGKLTIQNGSGVSNNSICLIQITRL